jgi:hypothetical protein
LNALEDFFERNIIKESEFGRMDEDIQKELEDAIEFARIVLNPILKMR